MAPTDLEAKMMMRNGQILDIFEELMGFVNESDAGWGKKGIEDDSKIYVLHLSQWRMEQREARLDSKNSSAETANIRRNEEQLDYGNRSGMFRNESIIQELFWR